MGQKIYVLTETVFYDEGDFNYINNTLYKSHPIRFLDENGNDCFMS